MAKKARLLRITTCTCGHRLGAAEVNEDFKLHSNYKTGGTDVKFSVQCAVCANVIKYSIDIDRYRHVITDDTTYRELFDYIKDTLFLCENIFEFQRVFEDYFGDGAIDVWDVIEFHKYLQACKSPFKDIEEIESWYLRRAEDYTTQGRTRRSVRSSQK